MNAGRLNRQINIQASSVSSISASGEQVLAWSTTLTGVWASYEPLNGRELFIANQRYSDVNGKFTIRYSSVVNPEMRILFNGDYYDIKAVIDPNDEHRELQLLTRKIE